MKLSKPLSRRKLSRPMRGGTSAVPTRPTKFLTFVDGKSRLLFVDGISRLMKVN